MNKRIVPLLLFLFCGLVQASSPLDDLLVVPEGSRQAAPDFIIENLRGGDARLEDYKGSIVLLNFWATWCMPCRAEMPSMETLWQKYKGQDFVIVAISIDEGSKKRVEKFIEILDLSFPVLLDPESKVNDLYRVSNMPTSFLIDRNGKIISRIVGSDDWTSEEAIQLVETLLDH
jgi:peroxiredoxin